MVVLWQGSKNHKYRENLIVQKYLSLCLHRNANILLATESDITDPDLRVN